MSSHSRVRRIAVLLLITPYFTTPQELLDGAKRPIAPGMVRRKKEKVKAPPRDKSKGFA